ncbi:MAG: phosphate/phosphite/phosphonate ABC transporter substrate-binding protein [Candidatus Methylumidiphilus sp.]
MPVNLHCFCDPKPLPGGGCRNLSILRLVRVLALALVCAAGGAEAAGAAYSVGVVPQFEARELASIWVPILAELSKRTGLQLSMKGSPRIPEFEVAFEAGEFDFAYMNPYHALIAARKQGYLPLVRDSKPLFGVLAVRQDSPYKDVKALAGKKISFPAPNAFGASLLMRADLDTVFHIKIEPLYAQTHTSAYLNTALGVSEASGGVKATFEQQPPDVRDNLRILYETRKVPSHPFLAHPRVPEADRKRVQQAILDMAATPDGAALLAKVPMPKATVATAAEYAAIKGWKLEKYYVKSGD